MKFKDKANPTALLLSSIMMLRYMSMNKYADKIEKVSFLTLKFPLRFKSKRFLRHASTLLPMVLKKPLILAGRQAVPNTQQTYVPELK